jgi:multiple antibiotic resistance protein
MTRIMGFLLVCMGMQFCINGIKEVAQDPVFHGAPAVQTAPAQSHAALDHLPAARQP